MKGIVREEDNGTFTARVYVFKWGVHVEANTASTFSSKHKVKRAVKQLTDERVEFYNIDPNGTGWTRKDV